MKAEHVIIRENYEPLVELVQAEFDCKPQYFKQGLSTDSRIFLRETVVEKLRSVKAQLPAGWTIRIWDGWRPLPLQAILYDRLIAKLHKQDPAASQQVLAERAIGYVYPPTTNPPAPHATGGTVDMTFADASGQAVNFGTGFDDFSERAHADYFDRHAPATKDDTEAAANRKLLFFLMAEVGFFVNPSEWWHFTYGTVQWAAAKGVEIARYGATKPIN